jgi:hypothetical protein
VSTDPEEAVGVLTGAFLEFLGCEPVETLFDHPVIDPIGDGGTC